MGTPYKMKNSMLKMVSKGSPMQKNYAGSPMRDDKKDIDPNPPTYNQQDSSWAIGIRTAELRGNDYRPTVSEVDEGSYSNAKQLLKETDANIKKSGNYGHIPSDTKNLLKKEFKKKKK